MPSATMEKIWNESLIESLACALKLIMSVTSAITEVRIQTVRVNLLLTKLPKQDKSKRRRCAANTDTTK